MRRPLVPPGFRPPRTPQRQVEAEDLPGHVRGELLAMASGACSMCRGAGRRDETPCACALRSIFLVCFRHYVRVRGLELPSTRALEYCTDFEHVLSALPTVEQTAIRLHYTGGLRWHECCRLMNVGKGAFWHALYNGMARAGLQLQQRRLFPVYEY